jgi:hypothetical protein
MPKALWCRRGVPGTFWSCTCRSGSDVQIYRGEFQGSYPVTPGHEFTGEEGGGLVSPFDSIDSVPQDRFDLVILPEIAQAGCWGTPQATDNRL